MLMRTVVHCLFITVLLNERDNLPTAYQQILEFNKHFPDVNWEYVLVDDGSTDGSWQYISELSKKDARVRGVRFTRNFGAISAVMAGCSLPHAAACGQSLA